MIAVQAYYDGENIKPLEAIDIKRNQKIILTIMDEYMKEENKFAADALTGKQNRETIDWEKYEVSGKDMRDGLSPEEYVRNLREHDRDEILF